LRLYASFYEFGDYNPQILWILGIIVAIFRIMIDRTLQKVIQHKLNSGKAIIVLGPRQTGKTTLMTLICEKYGR